jgi:hypothetical protein
MTQLWADPVWATVTARKHSSLVNRIDDLAWFSSWISLPCIGSTSKSLDQVKDNLIRIKQGPVRVSYAPVQVPGSFALRHAGHPIAGIGQVSGCLPAVAASRMHRQ